MSGTLTLISGELHRYTKKMIFFAGILITSHKRYRLLGRVSGELWPSRHTEMPELNQIAKANTDDDITVMDDKR